MPEDASLDDFLDASAESEEAGAGADERDEQASVDAADDAGDDGDVREPSVSDEPDDADAAETTDRRDAPDGTALDPSTVEGARGTYDWTPDGGQCEACDATVERRWRDESGLVCEACKDW